MSSVNMSSMTMCCCANVPALNVFPANVSKAFTCIQVLCDFVASLPSPCMKPLFVSEVELEGAFTPPVQMTSAVSTSGFILP